VLLHIREDRGRRIEAAQTARRLAHRRQAIAILQDGIDRCGHLGRVEIVFFENDRSARIGEQEFHWEFGDTLVVPGWTHFEFSASEEALLFQVNDEPLMRMLGFYRQES
jgi:gentisate 1,2-dioxygenase